MSPMAGPEERENTLNQLLAEMDGFDTRQGGHHHGGHQPAGDPGPGPDPPRPLRPADPGGPAHPHGPGRDPEDPHQEQSSWPPTVDLHTLAARTPGMVGSDLANIVNEAALLAARRDRDRGDHAGHFEEAIDRVVAGLEKRNRVMNPREKEIVAYHETGHALVAEALPSVDPVHRVSIIPRGIGALGYTMQLPTEDRYLMTRNELEDRMAVMLGGRVAEEVHFGEISTGAQNDLLPGHGHRPFHGAGVRHEREAGPHDLRAGAAAPVSGHDDAPLQQRLQRSHGPGDRPGGERPGGGAHHRAKEILEGKRATLEQVAKVLLEKEVI